MTSAIRRAACPSISSRVAKQACHPLKKGDRFPNVILTTYEGSVRKNFYTLQSLMGRRAVVFTVPGAFTPVCTNVHLASFKKDMDRIFQMGAGKIICVAPDKLDVAHAWNVQYGDPRIEMWADNLGELTDALGLGLDLSGDRALGYALKRSAMVINATQVEWIEIEENPDSCVKSHAKNVCDYLQQTSVLNSMRNTHDE